MATINVGYDASGNALDYTTVYATATAAATGDTLAIYYSDPYKNKIWEDTAYRPGKILSFIGMVDGLLFLLSPAQTPCFMRYDADFGGINAVMQNLSFIYPSYMIDGYGATATSAGSLTIDRCTFIGCGNSWIRSSTYFPANLTLRIQNCVFIGAGPDYGNTSAIVTGSVHTFNVELYKNTFISGSRAIRVAYANSGTADKAVDNLSVYASGFVPVLGDFRTAYFSELDYNATVDGSGGTNGKTVVYSDIKWMHELRAGSTKNPIDFRIAPNDTTVRNQGTAITGIPNDIDEQSGNSMGASNGVWFVDPDYVLNTYTPNGNVSLPDVGNVLAGVTFGANDELTGTFVTDYPAEAVVKNGVIYGIGVYTGTLISNDPGIANVVNGITYTINSVNKTGTRIDTNPGIANVKTGTTYYINSVEYTGNFVCDYPTESDVKFGVIFGDGIYTGTLKSTDPGVANVVNGVGYYIESSAKTGTRIDTNPGAANVLSGTTYYINSVEYAGTFVSDYPTESNVKLGVIYGSSVYTGTLESTDPGVTNVESGVTYKIESVNKIGTRIDTDPGITNVRVATTYYIDSVLLTGTLTADLPTQGTLTATDNGNETVTLTITGTDATNTTNVYVRNTVHGAWEATALATITGNDSDTQALSAGDYEFKIVTENASGNQIGGTTDPVFLHVNNPDKSIQYYNVLRILGNPGDGKKRLLLEARTQPINPQTPTV